MALEDGRPDVAPCYLHGALPLRPEGRQGGLCRVISAGYRAPGELHREEEVDTLP